MLDHTVRSFDEELRSLDSQIARMGGLAEHMLANAIEALDRRDPALADATIVQDDAVDTLEKEIEELAIAIFARRQPVALDLRQVFTAIRVAGNLERIGDLSKNIAKRAIAVSDESHPKPLMTGVKHMGRSTLEQVKDVLDAYSSRDADKAIKIWLRDSNTDAMYNSLFRELLTYMMEDPRNIGFCTHLLFCAKNLERIGDHATNIAEMVYFLVHGKPIAENRPKHDTTSFEMPGGLGSAVPMLTD